jgi:predicted  nucleic acid-binding Zn-ribbon protein
MSSPEELNRRVTAVERELVAMREHITDTHTLAAHADRDVAEFRSELRAQTQLISALRETQVEQGAVLRQHSEVLRQHSEALGEIRVTLDGQAAGLAHIVRLLEEPANVPR